MISGMIVLLTAAAIGIGVVSIRLHSKHQETFQNRMQTILQPPKPENEQEQGSPEHTVKAPDPESAPAVAETEKPGRKCYIPPQELDLNAAAVPAGCLFSEAIEILLHLAKTYRDSFRLWLYVPVSAAEVAAFEQRTGIKLTEELRALYQFTNGLEWNCGYIRIMELDQVEKHLSDRYEWGDSRHYVWLGSRVGDGEGIYLDLDSGNVITVFEAEVTQYDSLTEILETIIDTFVECEVEDERMDTYLKKLRSGSEETQHG
jgi:hypothetical protein